jgi:hypothetical protein
MSLPAGWAPGSLHRVHLLGLRHRRPGCRRARAVNYVSLERLLNRTKLCVIFLVADRMDILNFKNLSEITEVLTYERSFWHSQLVLDISFTYMCKLLSSEIVVLELNTRHGMHLREYVSNQQPFSLSCTILRHMIRADSSAFCNKDLCFKMSWLRLLKQTSAASISIPINMECYKETFSWKYPSGDRSGVLTWPFLATYFY